MMTTKEIDDRIHELQYFQDNLEHASEVLSGLLNNSKSTPKEVHEAECDYMIAQENFSTEEALELEALRAFREELKPYCDWDNGDILIPESELAAHAQELAEIETHRWPLNHIDWQAAAEELVKFDYTYADLDGERYYVRCT